MSFHEGYLRVFVTHLCRAFNQRGFSGIRDMEDAFSEVRYNFYDSVVLGNRAKSISGLVDEDYARMFTGHFKRAYYLKEKLDEEFIGVMAVEDSFCVARDVFYELVKTDLKPSERIWSVDSELQDSILRKAFERMKETLGVGSID